MRQSCPPENRNVGPPFPFFLFPFPPIPSYTSNHLPLAFSTSRPFPYSHKTGLASGPATAQKGWEPVASVLSRAWYRAAIGSKVFSPSAPDTCSASPCLAMLVMYDVCLYPSDFSVFRLHES